MAPKEVDLVWSFLVDVVLSADPTSPLPLPTDGEEPRAALRECFDEFRACLAHLDEVST